MDGSNRFRSWRSLFLGLLIVGLALIVFDRVPWVWLGTGALVVGGLGALWRVHRPSPRQVERSGSRRTRQRSALVAVEFLSLAGLGVADISDVGAPIKYVVSIMGLLVAFIALAVVLHLEGQRGQFDHPRPESVVEIG